MKGKSTRQAPLPECEATFLEQVKTAKGQAQYQGLVQLITQVLDLAIGGADINMRIGATKARNAFIVTVYEDATPSYASGTDWETLLEQVNQLL